jgi:hypothetical protein
MPRETLRGTVTEKPCFQDRPEGWTAGAQVRLPCARELEDALGTRGLRERGHKVRAVTREPSSSQAKSLANAGADWNALLKGA